MSIPNFFGLEFTSKSDPNSKEIVAKLWGYVRLKFLIDFIMSFLFCGKTWLYPASTVICLCGLPATSSLNLVLSMVLECTFIGPFLIVPLFLYT